MDSKSFADWATVIGGFTGLLSFIYVLTERLLKSPKIVTNVRQASIRPGSSKSETGVRRGTIHVTIEIGNVGSEITTITSVSLLTEFLPPTSVNQSRGTHFYSDDHETRIYDIGVATVEHFTFFVQSPNDFPAKASGTLLLELVGGKVLKIPLHLKNEA